MSRLKNGWLWIAALVGLALFLAVNVAPLLSGDQPDAAKHAVDRGSAAAAAEQFVRERIGAEAELKSFAMYAADRLAFGYFDQAGLLEDVLEVLRPVLPLEAYRVEVRDVGAGVTHFVDINPYTGLPVEWELARSGEAASAGDLERIGQETLEALGLSGMNAELAWTDEEAGELGYRLEGGALGDAAAELTVRADAEGAAAVSVLWDVPDEYEAKAAEQDTLAGLLGSAGLLLSGALQFAAMIYALIQLKHVRWSRGAVMALAFGLLYCAINVNMYPGIKATALDIINGGAYWGLAELDPAETIAGLVAMLFLANAMTLALAIGLYFSLVAGDQLMRGQNADVWPLPERPGYASHVLGAVGKGYLFAPVLLGLQTILLLAADHSLDTWYTIDALTSANNMAYPALLPVLAWCAAISEEGVYRLFAIPALKKLVRFTVPAVLVSSLIWALGHVQYPIYPFYTRLVEVTVLGFAFAYIFLKHGFLAAVFAHAVVDLIWMGISITANSPTAANFGLSALYLASPLLVALAVRLRRRAAPPPEPA
ncbi:CPBP family intramembrane glutamic endopeptidase [Paenibacillus sp.]|uniref:CPBP family intramembrane glutamic endopeptidase n=1 Tax=Paenibacillus sp. TaxID=58172 RepID=UPI002D427CD8|nr:CPBP family intramembrane glutamic endopeptidase [Paenibacillus sp.]HZG84647.1 CPBP family intramembrane glutamic endopeptidase [Paenibacillus sp.]